MNSSCNCQCKCGKKVFRLKSVSSCPVCPCSCFVQPQEVPTTFTTGAIWRNPATDTIVVTVLNKTNAPQTVTVSAVNWQNCVQAEMPKDAYLCGDVVNPDDGPILTPFTFTIPAKKLLVVHATLQNAWMPGDPCYEVLVTMPTDPCIANTWGINAAGIPQEGNTVFHHQFRPTVLI